LHNGEVTREPPRLIAMGTMGGSALHNRIQAHPPLLLLVVFMIQTAHITVITLDCLPVPPRKASVWAACSTHTAALLPPPVTLLCKPVSVVPWIPIVALVTSVLQMASVKLK